MKTLLLAGTTVVALLAAGNPVPAMAQATKPVTQVVQWNRTLLVIVRAPGAQPQPSTPPAALRSCMAQYTTPSLPSTALISPTWFA
jgi:hypothetical protein